MTIYGASIRSLPGIFWFANRRQHCPTLPTLAFSRILAVRRPSLRIGGSR
jgi:hypothetical protein